jgi:hypothetical protein
MKQTFYFVSLSVFAKKASNRLIRKLGEKDKSLSDYLHPTKIIQLKNIQYLYYWMENIYLNRFFCALNYGAYWDDLPETIIVAINQNSPNTRV